MNIFLNIDRILCVVLLSLMGNMIQGQEPPMLDFIENQLHDFDSILTQEKIYIHSDRTFYKPGQDIWFSVYLLDQTLKPSFKSKRIRAEWIAPSGTVSNSILLAYSDSSGVAYGDFRIDENDLGGFYKIRVYSDWMEQLGGESYVEKEINVQAVVYSNLLLKLDFERESYGPGASVGAKLNLRTLSNSALVNKKVNYAAFVAGKKVSSGTATTDKKGNALIDFQLPKKLKSSDGLLTFRIEHEGIMESISRSIPILLNNVDLQFLPEGGNFIVGMPQKLAFIARDEFGQSADIEGFIMSGEDTVQAFKTYHQGMGAVDVLVEDTAKNYYAKITAPAGIDNIYPLNIEEKRGAIGLRLEYQKQDSLGFIVYNNQTEKLRLTLQMQGKLQYNKLFSSNKGRNEMIIPISKMPVGIAQVTLFDAQNQPQAERLVFVNKHKQLHIDIQTNKEKYLPREQVAMTIQVKDHDSIPVQGTFSLAVVDEKNITFADDKQDNILSQMLMSSDLKGNIQEPNFYFDPAEPKADTALDYVLLTHGWRRFDWKSLLAENQRTWVNRIQLLDEKCRIKGIAYVNGVPLQHQLIFWGKNANDEAVYNKNMAEAWSKTNGKGEFLFEEKELTFPAYLSVNYRGAKTEAFVYSGEKGLYESTNIKSNRQTAYTDTYNRNQYYDNYERERQRESTLTTSQNYSSYRGEPSSHIFSPGRIGSSGLTGRVLDGESGEFLPFVTIVLVQNNEIKHGTTTDWDGKYQIDNLEAGAYTLRVSFVSYETYEIELVFEKERGAIVDISLSQPAMLLTIGIVDDYGLEGVVTVQADRFDLRMEKASFSTSRANYDLLSKSRMSAINIQKASRKASEDLGNIPSITRHLSAAVKYQNVEESTSSYLNRYHFLSDPNSWQAFADIRFSIEEIKALDFYKTRTFYSPKYTSTYTSYRSDFRETIYWNPQIETDSMGRAKVYFCNSDDVSTFRATIEGIGGESVGHQERLYYTQTNLEIKTKVPTSIVMGDSLKIPVIVKNNTGEEIAGRLILSVRGSSVSTYNEAIKISPDSTFTVFVDIVLEDASKEDGYVSVSFKSARENQNFSQAFHILPQGFPATIAISGKEEEQQLNFRIDKSVKGSLQAQFYASPNPLDDMSACIEGILKEPHGCFEQVSSSNYPNILALQYMEAMGDVDPGRRAKALEFLKSGYQKLMAYETAVGGFELYGDTPPDLGLTAYGLLQFHDMQSVYDGVEKDVIVRTQKWLLDKRNGEGGFSLKDDDAYFATDNEAVSNAYILYALSEVGEKNVSNELNVATLEALRSKDLYRMGLMLLTYINYNDNSLVKEFWSNYEAKIKIDSLDLATAETTIVDSRGETLNIEVLAIGALAMMKMKQFRHPLLVKIIQHIAAKRHNGMFGSTQSTIWALKALTMFQKNNKNKTAEGEYVIEINGEIVQRINYSSKENKQININTLANHLKEGENSVKITCKPKRGEIPLYSFDAKWFELMPQESPNCVVEVETSLAAQEVKMGETVRLTANVENKSQETQGATVALIGIPTGLSLQAWQLKELRDKKKVDYIELLDEYIVLHYRDLAPNEKHEVHLDLKTEFAGNYQAPASTAYLYYHDELKYWSKGANIQITQ